MRMPRILLAAAALLAPAAARASESFAGFEMLELDAPGLPATEGRIGVLAYPADWQAGDGAAVLLQDAGADRPLGAGLAARLLGQDAAVLELRAAPGAAPDRAAFLFDALRALRLRTAAGAVVAIGVGPEAGAVLRAADAASGARGHGAGPPSFAAYLHLAGTSARFASGEPPGDAREAWRLRAGLLCAVLPGADRRIEEECRAAIAR